MKLNCHNCKYYVYSMESYCGLGGGNNFTQSMFTCTPLTKKINQIYFNRFIKENNIKDKKLIDNCKKIIKLITYIYLDEIRYAMVDDRGSFIEFIWINKDIEDSIYSIKVFQDDLYVQIYQLEKSEGYESFNTSLHLDMKDFKEKEEVVKQTLWTTIAIYLQRFLDVRNTSKKVQDIFNSIIKK